MRAARRSWGPGRAAWAEPGLARPRHLAHPLPPPPPALPDRHAATATTLFAAATLGSFYYTLAHGRSAWLDAETLLAGRAADGAGAAPRQHAPTFVMRLK